MTTEVVPLFPCDVCDKRFNTKIAVKNHIDKVHDGKFQPLKCEVCNLNFTWPKELSDHNLKEHRQVKRYKCKLCQGVYNQDELSDHLKTKHKDTVAKSSQISAQNSSNQSNIPQKCDRCDYATKIAKNMLIHKSSNWY